MNYRRIYDALMRRARQRDIDGYVERHHVIPKALGGAGLKDNIVRLTAREHFVAHWLLARIHGGPMWMPLMQFQGRRFGPGYTNSRAYEEARRRWAKWSSDNQRGPNHWAYGKESPYKGKKRPELAGNNNGNFGKKRTPEQIAAVTSVNRGKKRSDETKQKIGDAQRGELNHAFGKSLSPEHREKVRAAMQARRLSAEHKRRIGEAHSGRVFSPETRAKQSEAQKRRYERMPNPMKGRARPDLAERNRQRAKAAK